MDLGTIIGAIVGASVTAIIWFIANGITIKKSGGDTVQPAHAVRIDGYCKEIEALISGCNLSNLNITSLRIELDQRVTSLANAINAYGEELEFYHRKYVARLVEDYRSFVQSLDEITSACVRLGATSATVQPLPAATDERVVAPVPEAAVAASVAPAVITPPPASEPAAPVPSSELPTISEQQELPSFEQMEPRAATPPPQSADRPSVDEAAAQSDSSMADDPDTNTYVSLDVDSSDNATSEMVDTFMAHKPVARPPVIPPLITSNAPGLDSTRAPDYLPSKVTDDTEIIKSGTNEPSVPVFDFDPASNDAAPAAALDTPPSFAAQQTPPATEPAKSIEGPDSGESFIFGGGPSDEQNAPGLFDTDIAELSKVVPDIGHTPPFDQPIAPATETMPPVYNTGTPPAAATVPVFDQQPAASEVQSFEPVQPPTKEEPHKDDSGMITGDDLIEKMDSFFKF